MKARRNIKTEAFKKHQPTLRHVISGRRSDSRPGSELQCGSPPQSWGHMPLSKQIHQSPFITFCVTLQTNKQRDTEVA